MRMPAASCQRLLKSFHLISEGRNSLFCFAKFLFQRGDMVFPTSTMQTLIVANPLQRVLG
jgi:hypothetical protein